jgi:hypothetical protein
MITPPQHGSIILFTIVKLLYTQGNITTVLDSRVVSMFPPRPYYVRGKNKSTILINNVDYVTSRGKTLLLEI